MQYLVLRILQKSSILACPVAKYERTGFVNRDSIFIKFQNIRNYYFLGGCISRFFKP